MDKNKIKKNSTFGVIGVCGINGNLIARILSDYGYRVLANDMQQEEDCRFRSALEEYPDIEIIHGEVTEEFFDRVDYIILPTALIESKSDIYHTIIERNIPLVTVQDILETFEPVHPVICITGTNGKTTTTNMLKHISYLEEIFPSEHHLEGMQGNYGDIPALQSRLKCDVNIIETGTFGIKGSLDKLASPCKPDVGLITNITPDHLNKSGDFKGYAKVKGELISLLERGTLIVNNDDPTIKYLLNEMNYDGNLITFGLKHESTKKSTKECLCGKEVEIDEFISGCGIYKCDCGIVYSEPDYAAYNINDNHDSFMLKTPYDEEFEFRLSIRGIHNIYNAVGVIIIAHEILGVEYDKLKDEIFSFKGVPGRMDKLGVIDEKEVMVDYAHNPAGITTVLKELKNSYSRIVNVLTVSSESGIEADRDILLKSLEYADYVVPASHNAYVCAEELLSDNKYLDKLILPDNKCEAKKRGTLGANKEQVISSFNKALTIESDLIICTGEAAFKFKEDIMKIIKE